MPKTSHLTDTQLKTLVGHRMKAGFTSTQILEEMARLRGLTGLRERTLDEKGLQLTLATIGIRGRVELAIAWRTAYLEARVEASGV